MYESDVFSEYYSTKIWEKCKVIRKSGRGSDCWEGNVVHFERWEEPAYADAIWGMAVCYNYDLFIWKTLISNLMEYISCYFVPFPNEIRTEHVNVIFNSSDIRVKKVGYHSTSVFSSLG